MHHAIKLLVNPFSGGAEGKKLLRSNCGIPIEATQPNNIDAQLNRFISPNDTLIIAGGDGTFNLVFNALYRTGLYKKTHIVLYPLGTGNDLAAGFNIKKIPLVTLIESIRQGKVKPINLSLWQYEQHIFTNYLSFGIDAHALARVTRWRKYTPHYRRCTRILYLVAGILSLFDRTRLEFKINNDPTEPLLSLILCGLNRYGGGCKIDNPYHDIRIIKIKSHWQFIKLMLTRFYEKSYQTDDISIPAHLEISPCYAQIDGEITVAKNSTIKKVGHLSLLLYND